MDSLVAEEGDLGMTEPILKFRLSLDSAFRQREIRNEFFGGMQIKFPFGNLKMGFFEFCFGILVWDQIYQGCFHL